MNPPIRMLTVLLRTKVYLFIYFISQSGMIIKIQVTITLKNIQEQK